jgi:Tfp pilus assembly major pilin PilA
MRFRDKQVVPLDDEYREMLGFMISVAVIFIIGTLALGIHKNYVYKSSVSEIFSNIPDIKIHFHEHYAAENVLPDSDDVRSYFANTRGISYESYELFADENTGITGAVITVSIISDLQEIDGDTISYLALKDSSKGVVVWLCGYALHPDYPFAAAQNRTTLKREYLPEICRD